MIPLLIIASLNWQMTLHTTTGTPRPRIQTLFFDHDCFSDVPVDYGNFAFFRQTGAYLLQFIT